MLKSLRVQILNKQSKIFTAETLRTQRKRTKLCVRAVFARLGVSAVSSTRRFEA